MTLAAAFTTAWKDLKTFGSKAVVWIAKEAPVAQSVVSTAGAIVSIVDPALAPAISTFDTLEESIVGKLAALASDTSNATNLETLFGEAWPTIQALVATLKNHPAVVAASTPPKA